MYERLSKELIGNSFTSLGARSANISDNLDELASVYVSGDRLHLVATSRKRKKFDGATTQAFYQGRCRVCKSINNLKFFYLNCRDDFHEKISSITLTQGAHVFTLTYVMIVTIVSFKKN